MTTKNDYYQSKKHVMEYIRMSEGYDGKELVKILKNYLLPKSTILELGMGTGRDLDILKKEFDVTGSDNSHVFLDMYREKHPNADLIHLDAEKLDTNRRFDCIYSNKVLHHLTTKKLKKSIKKQKELLNHSGILFHSFWQGDKDERYKGLRFVYYTKKELFNYFSEDFKIIEIETYKEMEDNDSIYVIVQSK
jgi:cyclopropane fatty-acyl-phospholipid synthase-like methyltransferase